MTMIITVTTTTTIMATRNTMMTITMVDCTMTTMITMTMILLRITIWSIPPIMDIMIQMAMAVGTMECCRIVLLK